MRPVPPAGKLSVSLSASVRFYKAFFVFARARVYILLVYLIALRPRSFNKKERGKSSLLLVLLEEVRRFEGTVHVIPS